MNTPKVRDEDYINFIIATPRDVTATEAERVQPESKNAPAHDAFTRLLARLEPDAETLWTEARTQIDLKTGILILDDSTLEKPYSERNALVYRHWSGKQKEVVSGINLITLLWTDGVRCVPVDYRVFDKDTDGKTKNDHFAEMLLAAFERGFSPELVCFDSWYGSVENLKLVRALGWHFLTRLKSNRQIRINQSRLQAVSEAGLGGGDGTICWLKGFGEIKVFRVRATDGASEYWATSLRQMSETEREIQAKSAWRIEMYHRALKQQCLIERAQCRRRRPVINHVGLCIRAFVRIESHCYRERISWMQAKTSIIRDAVRAYLSNPRYLLMLTA
ncbi:MAG TPA: transposase [Pyrinomonadaceae bacterium]|nr:transposase [Pyrinomonadaceae bacterium]